MKNIFYVSIVGSLMCAQTCMRPDISFAFSMLGAKKVLRYLQGIKIHMLTYKRSNHLKVIRYKDSDFASYMDTRKFTFTYVCIFSQRIDSMEKCESVGHCCIHHGS